MYLLNLLYQVVYPWYICRLVKNAICIILFPSYKNTCFDLFKSLCSLHIVLKFIHRFCAFTTFYSIFWLVIVSRFSPLLTMVALADREKHCWFFCVLLVSLHWNLSIFQLILFGFPGWCFFSQIFIWLALVLWLLAQKCLSWLPWLMNFSSCLCLLSNHCCSLIMFSLYLFNYFWPCFSRLRTSCS